jgi:hypothetical protein
MHADALHAFLFVLPALLPLVAFASLLAWFQEPLTSALIEYWPAVSDVLVSLCSTMLIVINQATPDFLKQSDVWFALSIATIVVLLAYANVRRRYRLAWLCALVLGLLLLTAMLPWLVALVGVRFFSHLHCLCVFIHDFTRFVVSIGAHSLRRRPLHLQRSSFPPPCFWSVSLRTIIALNCL